MARDFRPFATWAELVDHIKAEYSLWYQGPMDARPVLKVNTIEEAIEKLKPSRGTND